jgi:molecular chaperone GrpE
MTNPPSDERADDGPGGLTDEDAAALREQLDQARAQYQRAVADYQNLQRRSQQDRLDSTRQTLTALVRNFLPVLDDLNRALDSVDAELADHRWVEGVRLVRQKFWGVLEAAGVSEIAASGERFDPQIHEAVGYAPGPDGCVAQLVQAGYAIGDRVIRPAMVLVGNGEGAVSDADDAAGATRAHDERS